MTRARLCRRIEHATHREIGARPWLTERDAETSSDRPALTPGRSFGQSHGNSASKRNGDCADPELAPPTLTAPVHPQRQVWPPNAGRCENVRWLHRLPSTCLRILRCPRREGWNRRSGHADVGCARVSPDDVHAGLWQAIPALLDAWPEQLNAGRRHNTGPGERRADILPGSLHNWPHEPRASQTALAPSHQLRYPSGMPCVICPDTTPRYRHLQSPKFRPRTANPLLHAVLPPFRPIRAYCRISSRPMQSG